MLPLKKIGIAFVCIAVLLGACFGALSYGAARGYAQAQHELEGQMAVLRDENAQLALEAAALKEQVDALERSAQMQPAATVRPENTPQTQGDTSAFTQTPIGAETEMTYIGNVKSKKFHLPTCPNPPSAANQTIFETRQAALNAGYTPCGNCKP